MMRPSDVAMSLPKNSRDLLRTARADGYARVHTLVGTGAFELLQYRLAQGVTRDSGYTSLTLTEMGREVANACVEL